jgi:hypothetical protein
MNKHLIPSLLNDGEHRKGRRHVYGPYDSLYLKRQLKKTPEKGEANEQNKQ